MSSHNTDTFAHMWIRSLQLFVYKTSLHVCDHVCVCVCVCACVRVCMRSTTVLPSPLCHSAGKWCVYMWIISSFGGELSPTVDHRAVFYFRWYTSSRECSSISPFPDLNYIPAVLFCDVIFAVSVAMAVMWVPLEHARTIESTFHVIVKSFQSLYQALLQELHSPPTS